jgi:hypothetical protein
MDVITNTSKNDIEFYIDMQRKKAYPLMLLNPDTVSKLFVLKPEVYTKLADAKDFLEAKIKIYGAKEFKANKLRYERDFVHLEDWRSLNHPPVRSLGNDLTIWDADYTPFDYSTKESVFYNEAFQRNVDAVSGTYFWK